MIFTNNIENIRKCGNSEKFSLLGHFENFELIVQPTNN